MMNVLIVYDSHYGSSSFVARAVAASFEKFATVRLLPIRKATIEDFAHVDFLVVGGGWGVTSLLEQLFIRSPNATLNGTLAAVFDTHYRHSASGLPTRVLSQVLVKHGATLALAPETFYVTDFSGPLEKGEPDRAEAWARNLAGKFELV